MDVMTFKLQREYHELSIVCNEQDKYVLGRDIRRAQVLDARSTFIRCNSEFVSRKHSEIFSDGHGVWKIKDLGSMNGTFLNSTKLAVGQHRELRSGDIIGLGISGLGPFDDDPHPIDITEPKYFVFKFTEVKRQLEAEIIDLTDSEDTCTVVAEPPSRSKALPSTSSNTVRHKAHDVGSPSLKPEPGSKGREGKTRHGRSDDTDSMKSYGSSSSKENKRQHRSRSSSSRSVSPIGRYGKRHKMQQNLKSKGVHYAVTSSDDDSSDGLSEGNRAPDVSIAAVGSPVMKKKPKLLGPARKRKLVKGEQLSLKPSQSLNQLSNKDQNIYSTASKEPVKTLSDKVEKLESSELLKNGPCSPLITFSSPVAAARFPDVGSIEKSSLKNDDGSDSDDFYPLTPKQNRKKVKFCESDDEADKAVSTQEGKKQQSSAPKAQACVRPYRKDSEKAKSEEILPPAEYSRKHSDDEPEEDYEIEMDVDKDDDIEIPDDMDMEDDFDNDLPEIDEPVAKVITYSSKAKSPPQRQIKFLDDAPSPPVGRRKKGFGTVDRVSAVPSGVMPVKPSSSEWQSVDAVRDARKKAELRNRLKEISQKEKAEKERRILDEAIFKKPKVIPKVKNCSKSRSESLLVSMVGSAAAVEDLEKNSELVSVSEDSKVPHSHRELPMPTPEEEAKMPLHALLKSTLNIPVKVKKGEKIVPPVPRTNPLQKPNAVVNPNSEPKPNNDVQFRIHQKCIVPVSTRSLNRDVPFLLEDTIYKDICNWNPSWLEEQKRCTVPPEVELGPYRPAWKVISVLNVYQTYETYQSVFYPLMLHELWASIHQDLLQQEKTKGFELRVGIDSASIKDICPMMATVDQSNPPQGHWVDVRCHALVNSRKDIRKDLDLCVFKYVTKTKNSKNEESFHSKVTFAFVQFQSESVEEINSKTIVNNNVYQQNPEFKLKYSFNVIFHIKSKENFYIGMEKPGILKRISYVSPKLRDYKALISLPKFPLFQNILKPGTIENSWNFSEYARYDSLVSYCSSLNPRQKSVVDYVSNRIMKTPRKPDIMLIHGPPGTGKTRTIVGIIMQMMTSHEFKRDNPKILVCTPSNTAIDEIILRLHETFQTMKEDQRPLLVRVGETNKVSKTALYYTAESIAQRKMKTASAFQSINATIEVKTEEMQEKEKLKKELVGDPSKMTRVRALDREIKELATEIGKLEDAKALVLTTTKADQIALDREKNNVMKSAQIVCSTLNSCSNSKLKNMFDVVTRKQSSKPHPKFTCCIVDEATQTTEPESLAPLTFNIEKLVLVGDPMQLDATVVSQKAKDNFYGRSLYHRLYDTFSKQNPSPVMMLREQYRMHEEILKWPNDSFYGGKLIKKPIRKNVPQCPLPPYLFFNLTSRETGDKGKISNEAETALVVEILKTIQINITSSSSFSIGVITPYGRQKDVLSKAIKEKVPSLAAIVEVDTVDSFQGREKDIVLISCVRTDSIGFLNNAKRLNVALTRAIHSLFIIGNADCLKRDDMWESLIEDATIRNVVHTVSTDKTQQSSLLASLLIPILASPKKSEIAEDFKRPIRLGI